jgi:hypothetical protein
MAMTALMASDSVMVSEALTGALKKPVADSVRAIESDAELLRLIAFVVLSLRVRTSDAEPCRKEPD